MNDLTALENQISEAADRLFNGPHPEPDSYCNALRHLEALEHERRELLYG